MKAKNVILALLFLITLIACNIEEDHLDVVTPDNFPDSNFFKFLLESYDINKDGKLDIDEVNAVREMNFTGNVEINSMEGIELFQNLEKLTLAHVLLGDHSVLNLSGNTNLKELHVNHTGITTLDVSHNTFLERLDCNTNRLMTLNIGSNAVIKYLNCHSNFLENLDPATCPNLEVLYCGFNLIEELDLTGNPLLEVLHCNNNKITKINIGQNPELRDLDISVNEISFLNFTQNTRLKKLACNETSINSLDIRNTVIDSLSCSSFYLKSLHARGSRTLKWLQCSGETEIVDAGESTLETIKYNQRRNYTGIDRENNATLLLDFCPNLKTFEFMQFEQHPRGLVYVFNYGKIAMDLSNCQSLQSFSANYITDLKINNCPALKSLTCIGEFPDLDLSNNGALETVYCYSTALETVNIASCVLLNDFDCSGLFKNIDFSKNRSMEKLRLVTEGLTAFDVDALSKLKHMELGLCNINATFKIHLNPSLEVIHIYDTIVGSKGEMNLKLEIADLSSLKDIKMNSSILSKIMLENCPKVERIDCSNSYSYFTYEQPSFSFDVDNCPSLQNIYVTEKKMNHFNASNCNNIDTVNIANNNLTSIRLDKSVKYLDCSDNQISTLDVDGFTRLKELYCASNEIAALTLDRCNQLEALDCSANKLMSLSPEKLSGLKLLYCNKNQLAPSLNVSNNHSLDKLNCADNQIKQLFVSMSQTFFEFKIDAQTEIVYVVD